MPAEQVDHGPAALPQGFTNVEFVASEGSFGLHNWDYSREIVNMAMQQAKVAQTGVVVKLPWAVTFKPCRSPRSRPVTTVKFSGTVKTAKGVPGAGKVKIMKRVSGVWKVWKTATLNVDGQLLSQGHDDDEGHVLLPCPRCRLTHSTSREPAAQPQAGRQVRPSDSGRAGPCATPRRAAPARGPPFVFSVPDVARSDVRSSARTDAVPDTCTGLVLPIRLPKRPIVAEPYTLARSRDRLSRASLPLAPAPHLGPARAREQRLPRLRGTRHVLRGDTQTQVTTPAL